MNFKATEQATRDAVEEALILGDIDVREVSIDDNEEIEVRVAPSDMDKAKDALKDLGVTDFDRAETTMYPNEWITVDGDALGKLQDMQAQLDECEDVQAVYTNVENL